MKIQNYKITKYACYYAYLAMASVFCVPPMLFNTFRDTYNIPYTLLGTLILVNFFTQLSVDLIFTVFSSKFNIAATVRVMPLITALGFSVYALIPTFFPDYAYAGLIAGTILFSIASGLCEVLLSPLVAALPSDTPEKDLSILHSLYAWGLVFMVSISTVFLKFFGTQNWAYLILILAVFPLIASLLFFISPIPEMNSDEPITEKNSAKKRALGLALCFGCIFLGAASENTMSGWVSSFIENLGVAKEWGDLGGLAGFAILLGLGRVLYAKYGKNIINVLLWGMVGAIACYVVIGLSSNAVISFIACVLTGICTSMLWPGTLIMMEENIINPGVAAFALMAAGGDLGASVGPQLQGVIVDAVANNQKAIAFCESISATPEQLGMRAGMLVTAIFPLLGFLLIMYIKKYFKK